MSDTIITRREFLQKTTAAALAATVTLPFEMKSENPIKSKVLLIRHQDVIDKRGQINEIVIRQMLDESVTKLLDVKNPTEAWKILVKPTDIVGIKSNVWRYLPTPEEIEINIRRQIINASVKEQNIAIDDRGVLDNPIFQKATVLINMRPFRTHNWSGVGGCIKNYVMFTPKPSDYHSDSCADLGALWNLPIVKGKTRLNILVMLTPQFHCLGPHHFDKEYTWAYNGLLVGHDPVALDSVGLKIIEMKRRLYFKEDLPLRPSAKHIVVAEKKHKIGISDLNKIEIIKLGWMKDALI
ncbi:MAG: DUF362 domain-containing protein [Bacteroidota bacterium]|nr:DUF362 domain-containing protein [Bacteroidota bacterium]